MIDVTGTIYTEKPSRQYAEVLFERNMDEIPLRYSEPIKIEFGEMLKVQSLWSGSERS